MDHPPGHDVGVVEELKVEDDVELLVVGGDAVPLLADLLLPVGLVVRHGALLRLRLQVRPDAPVEDPLGQVGEQLDQQPQGRLARRVRALGGNSTELKKIAEKLSELKC